MIALRVLLSVPVSPSPSHSPVVSPGTLNGWYLLTAFAIIILFTLGIRAMVNGMKR